MHPWALSAVQLDLNQPPPSHAERNLGGRRHGAGPGVFHVRPNTFCIWQVVGGTHVGVHLGKGELVKLAHAHQLDAKEGLSLGIGPRAPTVGSLVRVPVPPLDSVEESAPAYAVT